MSPRSKKQFEELRDVSKNTIEETALELFGHQGFKNTSIAQIALKAGISKGLIYNYYSSKADLLRALITGAMSKGDDILDMNSLESLSPEEVLNQIVDAAYLLIKENQAYWKLLTSLSFQADVMEELREIIHAKARQGTAFIIPFFEKLGYPDPESQAFLFGATLDGIGLHFITLGKDYPLEKSIETFKKTYCKPFHS